MKDLLHDPLLYFAIISSAVIFGIAYVVAMIWSYNRDAKKKGKESGCMPVLLIFLLINGVTLYTFFR